MAEKRKVYHVSKRESDGMWAIHIQGSDTVIKLFSTKAEAETYCQTLGANQQGTILFHNSKGKAKGSISTTQVHKKEVAKAETKVAKPRTVKSEDKVTATEKPVAKKTAEKKVVAKKPAAKKATVKAKVVAKPKVAAKKTPAKKVAPSQTKKTATAKPKKAK